MGFAFQVFLSLALLRGANAARKRVNNMRLERSEFLKMNLTELPIIPEGGRCMKGGHAGYYYRPGTTSVWVFHLSGGGGCGTYATCKKWANAKGSLDGYSTMKGGKYWWSPDPVENPVLHNAHHVFVPYCTGDLHAGRIGVLPDPSIEVGEQSALAPLGNYYFNGHNNIAAILNHLHDNQNEAFVGMTEILFSGQSAGGIGVFKNCNDFVDKIHAKANSQVTVSCAADAGWFVPAFTEDHPDDVWASVTPFQSWRVDQLVPEPTLDAWVDHKNEITPQACLDMHVSRPWVCGSASVIYPHIVVPMFIIQDQFDTAQLRGVLGLNRVTQASQEGHEYMAYFGRAQLSSVKFVEKQIKSGLKDDGLFVPSCYEHGIIGTVQGFNFVEALSAWYSNSKAVPRILIDDCDAEVVGVSHGTACGENCPRAPIIQPPCPAVLTSLCSASGNNGQCMNCVNNYLAQLQNLGECTNEEMLEWCELLVA